MLRQHDSDARVWLTDNPADLSSIHKPGVKAVIWRRSAHIVEREHATIQQASAQDIHSLSDVFTQAAIPHQALADYLEDDIVRLVDIFNGLSSSRIEARAEDVLINGHYTDAPLKGDADWPEHHAELGYELRLISAFAGRGTEWISGDISYRELLALNQANLTENFWGVQRHHYLQSRDVIVLKGSNYEGCDMAEENWSPEWLVHREPLPQVSVPRLGIVMPYM